MKASRAEITRVERHSESDMIMIVLEDGGRTGFTRFSRARSARAGELDDIAGALVDHVGALGSVEHPLGARAGRMQGPERHGGQQRGVAQEAGAEPPERRKTALASP